MKPTIVSVKCKECSKPFDHEMKRSKNPAHLCPACRKRRTAYNKQRYDRRHRKTKGLADDQKAFIRLLVDNRENNPYRILKDAQRVAQ
jgi:predicted sulfurtransferase